jgi:hypothetical protein
MKSKLQLLPRIEALEARIAPAVIYGIDASNNLIVFDSETPSATQTIPITGLSTPATELIKGIDFRPATGELYALGIDDFNGATDEARIYTINVLTGDATQVGNAPFLTDLLKNNDYAFDFNPAVDRIRIISDRDDNIRVNPITGALTANDTDITGGMDTIIGAAYDRSFVGTTLTTLYGIDYGNGNANDALVTIGGIDGNPSPNGGVITTIGLLGVNVDSFRAGFDIQSSTGTAYAAMSVASVTGLYTIDLTTGAATLVGPIGGDPLLHGIAVRPYDLTFSADAKTATYIDQDGDKVVVKSSKGAFIETDFSFASGPLGAQLRQLNIADDNAGQGFAKSTITITASRVGDAGDGFANIGYIRALGVDLGKVTVDGDLGQIDAGDATTTTPGLAGLTVHSMGLFGTSTQLPASPDLTSSIIGKLGALTIKTDLNRAQITVTGGADGSIGNILIGGDVTGGAIGGITSSGNMGSVTLLGSLYGGTADNAGNISAGGTMGKVTVGGTIHGGSASQTGIVQSTGNMGAVLVKGDVQGGTDDHTGNIYSANGAIASVTINGSIIGGFTGNSSLIDSGIVYTTGLGGIGPVKVLGSLIGSDSDFSGSIYTNSTIKSVIINGSIKGGTGDYSGAITVGGNLGNVTIGVDARGSTGDWSGSVHTFQGGNIAGVTIKGSLIGDGNTLTGILSSRLLGAVKILGGVSAEVAEGVRISAGGAVDTVGGIKSIAVLGSIKNALIVAGYTPVGLASNPDASIGAITVGGNLVASSIAAGALRGGDNLFGTQDDAGIAEGVADAIVSKIASITVKGMILGTTGTGDSFGIVADEVTKISVGGSNFFQIPGANNDPFAIRWEFGYGNDVRIFEVPA